MKKKNKQKKNEKIRKKKGTKQTKKRQSVSFLQSLKDLNHIWD